MLLALSVAVAVAGCDGGIPVPQILPSSPPPPPVASTQTEERDYLINPGDVLEVSVWKEEGMQREVLVLPDGTFSFPLVGFIKAAGRSPADVQKTLTERIKRFIPHPVVTISVSEVAGNSVFVLGYVKKPGEYRASRQLDVLQALSLAGGLTVQASEKSIKIIRRENGHQQIYPFNFTDVKNGVGLETNIILNSGDTVIVPGSGFFQ
jgi:polysaccharide export outer membrane protein